MNYLPRRYAILMLGLFCISLGIGFITKASLGTTPITSIPYTLSITFPSLSVGEYTILFSALLVFLQWLLMGIRGLDRIAKVNLVLELFISIPFGYMVDLSLWLFSGFNPDALFIQLLCVVIGAFVLGFGVYLQIVADVVMVPGDGFVYALVRRVRIGYGKIRLLSDMSMVSVAAIVGFVCTGSLVGVGVGTIMSCILTGPIARRYMAYLENLTSRLVPGKHLSDVANGGS